MKPLLLIDVDGPLNPYANSNNQLRKGKVFLRYKLLGFVVWLNRQHGEELMKLTDVYDLVWCTTWEHSANSLIGPRIGLPDLPVIEFPPSPSKPDSRLYFKTAYARAYVGDRPFAWVDDEITDWDSWYLADTHEAPTFLLKVDPAVGLCESDFKALRMWGETVVGYDGAA